MPKHETTGTCIAPHCPCSDMCLKLGAPARPIQASKSEAAPDRSQWVPLAHEIATKLWDAGLRESDGLTVLSMALGIYLEAHEDTHRNFRPLIGTMLEAGQKTFDRLREGRQRRAGNA